jgi:hypothetical protein
MEDSMQPVPFTQMPQFDGVDAANLPQARRIFQLTDWKQEDAVLFTQQFIECEGVKVLADRSFEIRGELAKAETGDGISEVLRRPRLDFNSLIDRLRLGAAASGYRINGGLLRAALNQVVEVRAAARRGVILDKLYVELSDEQKVAADLEWLKWASVFDMDPTLSIAITQHFIWQMKRKSIGLPVYRHLVPVIYSTGQGTGKSTAVHKLVDPLEEIGDCVILVDQLSDSRSTAFEDPFAFLDDLGFANPKQAANLKAIITADKVRLRKMQTSQMQNVLQKCTMIATANRLISDLIPDPTGQRRFAMLPFKNGQVSAGGEAHVWPTISGLASLLLWQSVLVFERSPIDRVIPQLLAHQGAMTRDSNVCSWLKQLDLSSPDVKKLRTAQGIRVRDFFTLYAEQTGVQNDDRSVAAAFFNEMQELIKEDWCALTYKTAKDGRFYVPKRSTILGKLKNDAPPPSPPSPLSPLSPLSPPSPLRSTYNGSNE